jgi:predicted Zn-dependent peptidase
MPTEQPFLYTISVTIAHGVKLEDVERPLLDEVERLRTGGLEPGELERAKRQLRARLVFENDSVTTIAHQLGYFSTVATLDMFDELGAKIAAVTEEQVAAAVARRLLPSRRTIGWFRPEGV